MKRRVVAVLCGAVMSVSATLNAAEPSNGSLSDNVLRIVSSQGEELKGALAYFLPSHKSVIVGDQGLISTSAAAVGDNQVFVLHPGYTLFESNFRSGGINLVVRSTNDAADAQKFAALPEFERVLQSCRPKISSEKSSNAPESVGAISVKSTETSPASAASLENAEQSTNTIQSLHHDADVVMSLNIAPNPSEDLVHIRYALAKDAEVIVELFRLGDGKRVVLENKGMMSSGDNSLDLHLTNLSAGTYAVVLRSSTCQYAMSTFVKN